MCVCMCTFASTAIIWLSRRACVFVPNLWLPRQYTALLSMLLALGFSFPMKRHQRGRLYSYSLRAGQSGDRIPVVARFSASVPTVPGTHLASCTVGTGSVSRLGLGVDHPPCLLYSGVPGLFHGWGVALTTHPPSSVGVKERVEVYLSLPFVPLWQVIDWPFWKGFKMLKVPVKTIQMFAASNLYFFP